METYSCVSWCCPKTVFKSYYVVWKLFFCAAAFCAAFWFKSYYVVWKQQEWKEIDDGKDGLNRTM